MFVSLTFFRIIWSFSGSLPSLEFLLESGIRVFFFMFVVNVL